MELFFEPTDRRKAIKPFLKHHNITYASPNISELSAIAHTLQPQTENEIECSEDQIMKLSKVIENYVKVLIITMGSKGVMVVKCREPFVKDFDLKFYPTECLKNTENVSGAGDCFASGFIYGILLQKTEETCVTMGFDYAKASLLSKTTVPKDFFLQN